MTCECGRNCIAAVTLEGGTEMCLGLWMELTGGPGKVADQHRREVAKEQRRKARQERSRSSRSR